MLGILPAAFGGVAWGILGGALPGISPSITMALLLPFTYGMDPAQAIVLLAATYVGAEYGGSIPAILIRTPGTNAAAATIADGYAMKQQGRAGEALGISLYSGFVGGLFGLIVLVLLTERLSEVALAFTPPAYFALGVLGLSVIASLSRESLIKGLAAGVLGLMVATVGTDPVTGASRFTFDAVDLLSGIPPILVMVGVFAVAELFEQSGEPGWEQATERPRIRFPSPAMWKRIALPQAIGSVIGTFEGIVPGSGGTVSSFLAYNEARRWSRHQEEFGHGSPEGVAAPEAANNTVACTALIPMLSLGIPGSNSAAVLLGGFLLHGLIPGPLLFVQHRDIVESLYVGLFAANIAMVVVGYLMMTPAIWLVGRPKPYLMAFIYALVVSGVYAIEGSLFQVGVVLAFGLLGYAMRYFRMPVLPLVLGVVLGFMVESNYRRALVLSSGDHLTFVREPLAAGLLAVAALFLVGSLVRHARERTVGPTAGGGREGGAGGVGGVGGAGGSAT
ncbi:MAG: tripartite tricarboxylate transporter permease [Acidobacteria bacterium]|nr:tripartite tricarboxylate transporter permease [Acidobacteriota bacterium]